MNDSYQKSILHYYFWLPAGKDEFGFEDYQKAPFGRTAYYRDQRSNDNSSNAIEQTISDHLARQDRRIRGRHAEMGGFTWTGNMKPRDADLGLRMISFDFRYEPAGGARDFSPVGAIPGKALILSNGLYLWSFEIWHEPTKDISKVREGCRRFLDEDFIKSYIEKLFCFNWKGSNDLNSYDGVLTYYQLDLLFNGIFHGQAHPHGFLAPPRSEDISDVYSVENVIKSVSMAAFKGRHKPLFDQRKDYSLRGAYERVESFLDTDIDLYDMSDSSGQDARERLLSRLSYGAMEQFLRVANSFGMTQYKMGLDHCRAELTRLGLLSRLNRASNELRRPSLSSTTLALSHFDSYHALVAGKIPTLLFMHNLVQDLADVSRPLRVPLDSVGRLNAEWIEWTYSRSTLDESISQFERQIVTIQAAVAAIDRSLATVHVDQILAELTESRKLAEIEAESGKEVVVNEIVVKTEPQTDPKLVVTLTWFALVLGAMDVYGNFGVWFTERFFEDQFFPEGLRFWRGFTGLIHWFVVIPGVIAAYAILRKRIDSKQPKPAVPDGAAASEGDGSADHQPGRPVVGAGSHVFDYSFLREPVNANVNADKVVRELVAALPDLEAEGSTQPSASVSTFRETPSSGVERTKYSLESARSSSGASYVLHIEIDRRWADSSEQLRDVRLVVRNSSDSTANVVRAAQRVIMKTVEPLVLVGKDPEYVRAFFESRFGWEVAT